MLGKILRRGPWQIPYKATNVLCSDGKRRTIRLHSEPDTFFSIPGKTQVKGKTVTGFILSFQNENGWQDLKFCAYQYRKNGYLLP